MLFIKLLRWRIRRFFRPNSPASKYVDAKCFKNGSLLINVTTPDEAREFYEQYDRAPATTRAIQAAKNGEAGTYRYREIPVDEAYLDALRRVFADENGRTEMFAIVNSAIAEGFGEEEMQRRIIALADAKTPKDAEKRSDRSD